MTRHYRATQHYFVGLAIAISTVGCAPKVLTLDEAVAAPRWPNSPFPASVMVERFSGRGVGGDRRAAQENWAGALVKILRDHKVFARVKQPTGTPEPTDLILRGDVQSRWDARGVSNFFTWWPGGLVFAPNWYGTRLRFFAEAKVELVDTGTGKRVSEYNASTSHELVHRSASPGPFFGALIIVPGVVKGATLTWPRAKYKALVEPVAYAELWQRVAGRIVEDRTPVYVAEAKAQKERCGQKLDQLPAIGQDWADFRGCQSSYYEPIANTLTDQGIASIFQSDQSKIYVTNGAIVRWEQGAAVGARPPGTR